MDTELQYNGKTYRRIGDAWYDTVTYIRAPLVIARELDARLRAQSTSDIPPPKPKTAATANSADESTFHHAEVFPIIAGIIRELCQKNDDYVTHREIVSAFLTHPEGRALAEQAAAQQENPIEQVASNIVAWFSKRFTEGATPYQDEFERKRVKERWAYSQIGRNSRFTR